MLYSVWSIGGLGLFLLYFLFLFFQALYFEPIGQKENLETQFTKELAEAQSDAAVRGWEPWEIIHDNSLKYVRWRSNPSSEDLMKYYPSRAYDADAIGDVKLQCYLKRNGRVDVCRVVLEGPEGYGFGEASLALAKTFEFDVSRVSNEDLKAHTIVIPVKWSLEDSRVS